MNADVSVMRTNPGEDPPTKRQKRVMAVVCTGVFLLVYVLSAGPMAGLHKVAQFRHFRKALEFVYAPLIAIVKSDVEPFASVLKWYIELFR